MERSFVLQTYIGVERHPEHFGRGAVPVGPDGFNGRHVSSFGYAEHGIQLRHGACRFQGGIGSGYTARAAYDLDGQPAERNGWEVLFHISIGHRGSAAI